MKWIKKLFKRKPKPLLDGKWEQMRSTGARVNPRSDWNRIVNYKSANYTLDELKSIIKEPNWNDIKFDIYEDISNYPLSSLSEIARKEIIDIIRADLATQAHEKQQKLELLKDKNGHWSPPMKFSKL